MDAAASLHAPFASAGSVDTQRELGRLTRELEQALERFRNDARLVTLVEKEVPDARQRLEHVIKLTDDAAHRTLDLVERSYPLAGQTAAEAQRLMDNWSISVDPVAARRFLVLSRTNMEQVRTNLNEVLLAQGYQDLTGQILRGVIRLVAEVESTLVELVKLAGDDARALAASASPGDDWRRGVGPQLPGAAAGGAVGAQQDVDALLSGLGV
jgi:chemotaxis protein CheZ